ncbi:MAG: helix-turn-helix domain-containing protein [Paludibacteraceae bacterium]|nr:helix-turn-helix domain-containing protein [Paludibacteraceae bacterium]
MKKETFNKRFIEAIDHILKNNRNVNKTVIAQHLGISNSKFSEILKERMNAGIDSIAIICQDFNISPEWMLFGEGNIEKKEGADTSKVKKLSILRQNELKGFDGENLKHCEESGQFFISDFKQADFAIRMTNDMMDPTISANAVVLCRLIEVGNFVQWGRPHALSTSQGVIICNPYPGSDDEHIEAQYANSKYKSFEIPKAEIKGMAIAICEVKPL